MFSIITTVQKSLKSVRNIVRENKGDGKVIECMDIKGFQRENRSLKNGILMRRNIL